MHNALRSLILGLPVLITASHAVAEKAPLFDYVQLELVFDHSSSMFTPQQGMNNVSIQRRAVENFLASYSPDHCVDVVVTYLPWGDTATPRRAVTLATLSDVQQLASIVLSESRTERGGTEHAVAFKKALGLLDYQASKRIMVFTTDEGNRNEVRDEDLHTLSALEDVTVYGISLGDDHAKTYLAEEVVLDPRYRFHAKNSDDFATALEAVFADVAAQFCLF